MFEVRQVRTKQAGRHRHADTRAEVQRESAAALFFALVLSVFLTLLFQRCLGVLPVLVGLGDDRLGFAFGRRGLDCFAERGGRKREDQNNRQVGFVHRM